MEQPTWSKNMGTPLFGSWSKESTEQQWGVSHNAGPVLTGQRQTKSKPTAFGGPVPMLRQFRPAFLLRPPLSIFSNRNQVNNSKQVELLPPSSEVQSGRRFFFRGPRPPATPGRPGRPGSRGTGRPPSREPIDPHLGPPKEKRDLKREKKREETERHW